MKYLQKSMKIYRALILFWTAFIGVGAVFGSMMFFLDPKSGFIMGEILPVMQARLPFGNILFSNFIFSGISLLIVNGITNLTAFVLILRGRKAGYLMGWLFGITLMLWISVQFYVFAPAVYPIDVFFFVFGLLQFITGYLAYVNFCQLQFQIRAEAEKYPSIGTGKSKTAVVFFSRMGYTRKLASEKADSLGCELIELKTSEHISGVSGFWWCGRFGMHRWGMKLEPTDCDFSQYDKIFLYSPVWVFSLCSPVRQFLDTYSDELKNVELTTVHFMAGKHASFAGYAAEKLGNRLTAVNSVVSHFGICKQ